MEPIKVVARYANGWVIKGFSHDFSTQKERFHIILEGQSSGEVIEVLTKDLKAVTVVRDFIEDPPHKKRKRLLIGEKPIGRQVEVRFKDGEVLVGTTLGCNLQRLGFFVTPADPRGNNIRVFVVCSAVERVRRLKINSLPGRRGRPKNGLREPLSSRSKREVVYGESLKLLYKG